MTREQETVNRTVYTTTTPAVRWCEAPDCGYLTRDPSGLCPLHKAPER